MVDLFDGQTIDQAIDGPRLSSSLSRVYDLMRDGEWRLLAVIASECETSEAGASARLRDLRKPRFRARYPTRAVERRRVSGGLWEYRVEVGVTEEPFFEEATHE